MKLIKLKCFIIYIWINLYFKWITPFFKIVLLSNHFLHQNHFHLVKILGLRIFRTSKIIRSIDSFYNLPSSLKNIGTTLGHGCRSSLVHILNKHNPSPNAYSIPSFANLEKRKGYTFGHSYASYSKVYQKGSLISTTNVPGPGSYQCSDIIGKDSNLISFRGKQNNIAFELAKKIPGPGTYETIKSISHLGNYFKAGYKNSGASRFNPSSLRFLSPSIFK